MKKPVILVTGANGQLGKELAKASPAFTSAEFVFRSRSELSIEDESQVKKIFAELQPAVCINCAAYTAVDKAETESEQAFSINARATGILADACNLHHTRFIHLSTDYVFDGEADYPLKEEDKTGPVNVYGRSKLAGEELALQKNTQTVIIRTAWVYSEFGNNFVKTMLRLMKERDSINVVNDQVGSPTYARELADAILLIAVKDTFVPGIFHYSSEGRISWYDFAQAIKEISGSSCRVNPIPTAEFPTPAKRPHFSLLDNSKIQAVYAVTVYPWQHGLTECFHRLIKAG